MEAHDSSTGPRREATSVKLEA